MMIYHNRYEDAFLDQRARIVCRRNSVLDMCCNDNKCLWHVVGFFWGGGVNLYIMGNSVILTPTPTPATPTPPFPFYVEFSAC